MTNKQVHDQRGFWRTETAFPEDLAPECEAPSDAAAKSPSAATSSDLSEGGSSDLPSGVNCLLVGPPGSGKTSFVASLEQACLTEGHDGDRLRFSFATDPGPEVNEIVSAMMSEGIHSYKAATKPRTYSCNVGRSQWRGPATVCYLRIRDEPGSRIFSANGARCKPATAWLDGRSGSRRCLAIFIDPLSPAAIQWRLRLPLLLRQLCQAKRLEAVLVLLSKIDLFCDRVSSYSSAIERATGHRSTPLDLARRIDPWQQATDLLGVATVEALRNAVSSPADLAFGLTSAAGFDPESGRLPRESGRVLPDWELGMRWSPFGIYDALRFIAFGEMAGHLVAPESTHSIHSRWSSIPLL